MTTRSTLGALAAAAAIAAAGVATAQQQPPVLLATGGETGALVPVEPPVPAPGFRAFALPLGPGNVTGDGAPEIRRAVDALQSVEAPVWIATRDWSWTTGRAANLRFPDGAEFSVRARGGDVVVRSTGGVIGGLPAVGAAEAPSGGVELVTAGLGDCGDDPDCGASAVELHSIAPGIGGLPGEGGFGELGVEAEPACGGNTGAPHTYCALFAVKLIAPHGRMFCTGTLISDRHVLTAGHCVCGNLDGSRLKSGVAGAIGAGSEWARLDFDADGVHVFDRYRGGVCAPGQTWSERRGNGDIAILTLAPGSLDRARDRLRALDARTDEVEKVLAPLPPREDTGRLWAAEEGGDNAFGVFGYGIGPDGTAGTKRGMEYTLRALGPCRGGDRSAPCAGVQEATFWDADAGLCAGDSGSGVFKWSSRRIEGYGEWVLMGVASGYANPSNCHSTQTDAVLDRQHERNIVRVDTPLVRDWIEDVVGEVRLARAMPEMSVMLASGE